MNSFVFLVLLIAMFYFGYAIRQTEELALLRHAATQPTGTPRGTLAYTTHADSFDVLYEIVRRRESGSLQKPTLDKLYASLAHSGFRDDVRDQLRAENISMESVNPADLGMGQCRCMSPHWLVIYPEAPTERYVLHISYHSPSIAWRKVPDTKQQPTEHVAE